MFRPLDIIFGCHPPREQTTVEFATKSVFLKVILQPRPATAGRQMTFSDDVVTKSGRPCPNITH
jgi:hypothetical protein